jgi:hypothetical protein
MIKMADLQIDLWNLQLKVQRSRAISQFIVDKAGSETGAKFRSEGSNVFHGAIDKPQNVSYHIGWSAAPYDCSDSPGPTTSFKAPRTCLLPSIFGGFLSKSSSVKCPALHDGA